MSPDPMEDALRQALRREDPGEEFTARVLARVAARESARRPAPWWRLRWAIAGAMAVVLLLAGGLEIRSRRQRAAGELARQQLVVALRITGSKLRLAQSKVVSLGAAEREERQ